MKTVGKHLIKPEHYSSLCDFADRESSLAKNLYNAALFRIRQIFTGWKKTSWTDNEREIFTELAMTHHQLILMIEYKAMQAGIRIVEQEESYTSKADVSASDPMPAYGRMKATSSMPTATVPPTY